MRLYNISESDILKTVRSPDTGDKSEGKRTAIKKLPKRFSGYPLKVVYETTEKGILIVTAYPLKRKNWR